MGTSHGAYKFSRKPDGDILAMNVVQEINQKLPEVHLVMHGSSSVPQELQDIFNEFGGEMPQTYGVPVEEIVRGIKYGVRKVNIARSRNRINYSLIRVNFYSRRWMRCRHFAVTASNSLKPRARPRKLRRLV